MFMTRREHRGGKGEIGGEAHIRGRGIVTLGIEFSFDGHSNKV